MAEFYDQDDDAEDPDDSDQDSTDDPEFVRCPYCRKMIAEDVEQCPHCGSYISTEDTTSKKPLWFLLGVVITIVVITVAWILKG